MITFRFFLNTMQKLDVKESLNIKFTEDLLEQTSEKIKTFV